jgi:phenylalanyl-tRNA synthetase beta chain
LGLRVDYREIVDGLGALGFFVKTEATSLTVAVPLWRDDVKLEADVIEEIARSVGYDRIAAVVPQIEPTTIPGDAYDLEQRVAQAAAAAGYREIVTFSLQSASVHAKYESASVALPRAPVEITNPLSEDQRFMRFSLIPAILELAARRLHDLPLRVFELGHVFGAASPQPQETALLVWSLIAKRRDEPPWQDAGFLVFKGESEAIVRAVTGLDPRAVPEATAELHPGKTAALVANGMTVAHAGALDPRLCAAFDVAANVYVGIMPLASLPAYNIPKYVAPSRFPGVLRDLALVVPPHVTAAEIEGTIRATLDGVARDVRVFDEYRGPQIGENKKSLAVRLLLQRDDATMTDAEADGRIAGVLETLKERLGATMRT